MVCARQIPDPTICPRKVSLSTSLFSYIFHGIFSGNIIGYMALHGKVEIGNKATTRKKNK